MRPEFGSNLSKLFPKQSDFARRVVLICGLALLAAVLLGACTQLMTPPEAGSPQDQPTAQMTAVEPETATPTNKPTETATATPTLEPTELAPLPDVITNTLSLLTGELNKNNEREEKNFEVVQKDGAWVLTENIAERETINSTYNMQTEKYESETLVREGRVLDAGVITPEGFIFNSNGVEQTVGLDMLATDGRATLIIKDENGEMRYKYSDYKGEWLENKWELSPDGHIYYNEAELYDGMFTINKEHPEWVEQYWEDLVRGLWNLNYVGENTAFLSQFPTDDSLVEHFRNGGKPISNLLIPSIYPSTKRQFINTAEYITTSGPIDLSKIVISIYKPTIDEKYNYSQSYASGTKYISLAGGSSEVWIKEFEMNGDRIIEMKFRQDILADKYGAFYTSTSCEITKPFTTLALIDDRSSKDNLAAINQLIYYWTLKMQLRDSCKGSVLKKSYNPPLLDLTSYYPLYGEVISNAYLEKPPFILR